MKINNFLQWPKRFQFINYRLPQSQPLFDQILHQCYFLFRGVMMSVWLVYKPKWELFSPGEITL
uniref:Uncharacterized protein n=1 Tax=Schistosoma haematobium TaxID=6185 RepID=A0A094ZHW0_SCHHA